MMKNNHQQSQSCLPRISKKKQSEAVRPQVIWYLPPKSLMNGSSHVMPVTLRGMPTEFSHGLMSGHPTSGILAPRRTGRWICKHKAMSECKAKVSNVILRSESQR